MNSVSGNLNREDLVHLKKWITLLIIQTISTTPTRKPPTPTRKPPTPTWSWAETGRAIPGPRASEQKRRRDWGQTPGQVGGGYELFNFPVNDYSIHWVGKRVSRTKHGKKRDVTPHPLLGTADVSESYSVTNNLTYCITCSLEGMNPQEEDRRHHQEDGKNLHQEDGKNLHQEDGKNLHQEDGKNLPQEDSKNLHQEKGKNLHQEDGKNLHQGTRRSHYQLNKSTVYSVLWEVLTVGIDKTSHWWIIVKCWMPCVQYHHPFIPFPNLLTQATKVPTTWPAIPTGIHLPVSYTTMYWCYTESSVWIMWWCERLRPQYPFSISYPHTEFILDSDTVFYNY